ncbi:hypothetical protein [uncultured Brevundimonas sp.]|uniref:hypothetical protein n=1 Tax=uncultured Brevundimonas sp. TaxID=213418 RepID=UPI0025E3473A|nr:hypothetical protein [uncultured Brevundimonas sp.]
MKKLTLTIDDDVYAGLHSHIGAGRISRFVNDLVRPLVIDDALDDAYAAMALDDEREQEADAWSEALLGDAAQ